MSRLNASDTPWYGKDCTPDLAATKAQVWLGQELLLVDDANDWEAVDVSLAEKQLEDDQQLAFGF